MLELWPADQPVVLSHDGLLLREWSVHDLDAMVALFDTAEMDRWTPLASPFDHEVARAYVDRAHHVRAATGTVQLAVTDDGGQPMGEVLVFPGRDDTDVELAYAIGAAAQGRGLGRRAIAGALALARDAGLAAASLTIAVDNVRSQRVAAATGFAPTGAPLTERRRKGRVLTMATWARSL